MRFHHRDLAYPLCAFLAVTACGGETDGGSSSSAGSAGLGGAGDTGGVAGDGGSGGSGGSASPECPIEPPTAGSACTAPWTIEVTRNVIAHCTWGDDPRVLCRTKAVCGDDGQWSVTSPDTATCSTSPLSAACPASPATPGTSCSDTAIDCWYEEGTHCWCSEGFGGSPYPFCQMIDPPLWACKTLGEGCPAMTPQAGSSCNTPSTDCPPEDCNIRIVCDGGVWQWHRSVCPICAAPDTPVATPAGERPIATLRAGDLVYTVDDDAIVVVPILRVASTPVEGHRVMRVQLENGAILEMSPGHPTADGRRFGMLLEGTMLDEQHRIVAADLVPYEHDQTYDILPGSSTGSYFAAGALVGSTL